MDLSGLRGRHRQRFGADPSVFAAPGRVNLIGEHTDYNDGFVLPIAIDRHTVAAMTPDDAPVLRVHSEALGAFEEIALDVPFERRGKWSDYIAGVAAAVGDEIPFHGGANLTIAGDLPLGAGLSSSASLELAVAFSLYSRAGVRPDPRRAAAAGRRAEHDFVGIRSGVMDQLVCALGEPDSALFIDCRSLEATPIALPAGVTIAVCDTGIKHALASSQYNERRAACERGVQLLQQHGLDIRALRDVDVHEFARMQHILPQPIRNRCRHVVFENQRTLDAVRALAGADIREFGRLMVQSHESLRDLYEVSSPELDQIVDTALKVSGVYGARMTGGGFGGAAIALLEPGAFSALRIALERAYYVPRGIAPAVFAVRASAGASAVTA